MKNQEKPIQVDANLTAEPNPASRPRVKLILRKDRSEEQAAKDSPPPKRRNLYEMEINGEIKWEDMHPKPKIGYGNPPEHTKFKPGKSGNPSGRPKGSQNLRTALEKIFTDKISVRIEGRSTKVTRLEAIFMQHMSKALHGDPKAMQTIWNTAQTFGLMKERPQQMTFRNLHALTAEELRLLESLIVKAAGIMEDI
jgi:hypothetical protein